MPAAPNAVGNRRVCQGCGRRRVVQSADPQLCKDCFRKYQRGELTAADLKPAADPGRPPAFLPEKPDDAGRQDDTPPEPRSRAPQEPDDGEKYYCDNCESPVRYGQRKCRKCGVWQDWRDTPAEDDPEILLCPRCGCNAGTPETPPAACPHCGWRPA